ncbi:GAF domain-containing protein [Streptomyces sp. RLA2-12]|uniref:GAF domain-containing protein n=1 Tax=Streptomyces sp. RLA2-12 TaxID=2721242 RepID=UPI00145F64A4|nr:GAF domain-containing protein [Streptomyces sp. RLA2-12]NMI57928.1 GAF domain-containing protein [Streptomyces sp. RLA2-12]
MILSETTSRLERGLRGELSALAVLDRTTRVLLDAVPADVWCGVVLDPSTLLDTGGQHESGFPESSMRRLFEIEHVEQDDVDNLRALTRRSGKVSLLSRSTDGRLDESKYYREILRPLGLTDELRILLRHGPRTWGLLVLCRDAHTRPFSAAELAVAEAVSVPACAALRRSLLLSGVDCGPLPDAPGWWCSTATSASARCHRPRSTGSTSSRSSTRPGAAKGARTCCGRWPCRPGANRPGPARTSGRPRAPAGGSPCGPGPSNRTVSRPWWSPSAPPSPPN